MGKTIMYEQIYSDLLNKIQRGIFAQGDKLPSEKELSEEYGVSRITSKRALDILAENQYITRSRGKGSFVTGNQGDILARNVFPEEEAILKKPLIGVVFDTFGSDFGSGLLRSIELECRKKGYDMLFRCSYGNIEEMHNAYALKHNQAMYEKVSENKEKRPFLQTRSGFTGSHRYASPWTGDITSDWTSMEQQLRLGLGLSMSGFSYWGFDIGGFSGSFTNDQYKRWVELSTFTPVHRFHYANWNESGTNGDCYNGIGKEPWNFDCEEISKEQINMRYELIPYFYSCTADSVIGTGLEGTAGKGTGIPLARPMVMEYYQDPQTYDMDSQFMCGPSFLVAPVVSDTTKKEVYFPAGTWYDYSDGTIISAAGGETKEYDAPIDKLKGRGNHSQNAGYAVCGRETSG